MRTSSGADAVQEDGGGCCACFLEAELAVLDELESCDQGAAKELEQHRGGEVLPEEAAFDAAREHRAHGCGDEALDLVWVALDLFANEYGVAVADCGQGAHDSLDRLFDRGAFEAGVGETSGGLGEGLGSERVE
jgi:hypothetical protein